MSAATATKTATYVYGVTARAAIRSLADEGLKGGAIRAVEHDRLAALVSTLPEPKLRVRRDDLTRHLRVLEAAFAQATIVPCAFGTVLVSDEAVRRELLEPRQDELLGLIRRFDGRVQLNVRAFYDEQAVLKEIVSADPRIAALRERTRTAGAAGYYDRVDLGELVAAALEARRAHDAGALLDSLAAAASEVAVDPPAEDVVLKASFLVPRARLRRFDRALEELARTNAPRIRFDSIGPLPPTAFVSVGGA